MIQAVPSVILPITSPHTSTPFCTRQPALLHSPKVLVQVAVCDLLQRLNLIHGYEVAVQVHELNGHLLEAAIGQQVALDALKRLVRVVVRLSDGGGA